MKKVLYSIMLGDELCVQVCQKRLAVTLEFEGEVKLALSPEATQRLAQTVFEAVIALNPKAAEAEIDKIIAEHGDDCEAAHSEADELLCEILDYCGYSEVVRKFQAMDKQYA